MPMTERRSDMSHRSTRRSAPGARGRRLAMPKHPAWLVAALAALLLTLIGSPVALAEGGMSQVTLSIAGGDLTYRLSSGAEPISFDVSQTEGVVTSGAVTLLVDDARGTHEGWAITIESTAFTYSGAAAGQNGIAAGRATVIPGPPALLAGPSLEGVHAGGSGTLESRRTVLRADAGAGSGRFQQELGIRLDVPAQSPAGTYSAMLTVSATSAPTGPN